MTIYNLFVIIYIKYTKNLFLKRDIMDNNLQKQKTKEPAAKNTVVRYEKESLDKLTAGVKRLCLKADRIAALLPVIDEIKASIEELSGNIMYLDRRLKQMHNPIAEEMRQYLQKYGTGLLDKVLEEQEKNTPEGEKINFYI